MFSIPIILGSTRRGRQSPKVARFIFERMKRTGKIETEILDLLEYNFPMMEERLRLRDDPPPRLREFADTINRADAVVVVSPEYNGGYPGVLKNCIDYLLPEFRRKPIGIVSVSDGPFGGLNALAQLRLVFLQMGALPIPARLPILKVKENFADDGTPADPIYEKSAASFIEELLWFTQAVAVQKNESS
jgi:NAD(P)H-dependent FMN reductase